MIGFLENGLKFLSFDLFKLNHVFAYTDEIGRLKVHCHSFFVKKDLRNIIENYFIQQNTRMKKNQDKKFIHLLISII